MSLSLGQQPIVRFSAAGPYGIEGLSFTPKVFTVKKTVTTVTEADDFLTLPANTYINEVIAVVTDACDANTQISLGQDGAANSLVPYTNFSAETVGNSYHFTTGLYLSAADVLRVTVDGTPAAGCVEFVISVYEIASMISDATHFDL